MASDTRSSTELLECSDSATGRQGIGQSNGICRNYVEKKGGPLSGHPGIGVGPYASLIKSCIHISALPRYGRKNTRIGSYAIAVRYCLWWSGE